MAEGPTCGQGIAHHAALPTQLGDLMGAMADNLEAHLPTLDLSDQHAELEHQLYQRLVRRHRQLAAELRATGEDMAGARDLPMGRHDQQAMASPRLVEAFETLVSVERELLAQLQTTIRQHEELAAQMGEAGGRG